jgi:hypothetical protein
MISYLEKAHQTHLRRVERAERERALSRSHTGDSLEGFLVGPGSRSPSPTHSPDGISSLSASPSRAPSPALGLAHSHSLGSLARLPRHAHAVTGGGAVSTSLSVSHTGAATGAGLDYTSAGNSLLPSLAAGAHLANPLHNFSHHLYSSSSVCPHRLTGAGAAEGLDHGSKAVSQSLSLGRTSRSSSAAPLPLLAPIHSGSEEGIGIGAADCSYWDEDFGPTAGGCVVKFGDHW